jgi:hypothetical protein
MKRIIVIIRRALSRLSSIKAEEICDIIDIIRLLSDYFN